MPSLFELRQDPLIQDRVQQRLQELNQLVKTGDKKIKSQRGGVDVFVKQRVKWQHEYVLSGSKYCKCNSFRVKTDLLNSENLTLALAQPRNELQFYSFTML